MKIEVNTDGMIKESGSIKTITAELQTVMAEIENCVISVNGKWQGDSEKAFAQKIIYVKNQFSNIISFFDEYAETLCKLANEYENFDCILKNKITVL